MKRGKKTGAFKERAYIAPSVGPDYSGIADSIANVIESEIAEITKCVSYALGAKHALDATKSTRELMQELRNAKEEMT